MGFSKGTSGNVLGRPIGSKGISKLVGKQTRDGAELIERLLELSRNPKTPIRERLAATTALLDRYAGRPLSPSEVSLTLAEPLRAEVVLALHPSQRLAFLDAERARRLLPEPDHVNDEDDE